MGHPTPTPTPNRGREREAQDDTSRLTPFPGELLEERTRRVTAGEALAAKERWRGRGLSKDSSIAGPLPTHFGPYVVERALARGGMGAILVVRHPKLGQRYALKVLSDATVSVESIARFEREMEALTRLGQHAHVMKVHASGNEGGRFYYVMDLLDGEPLNALLEHGPLEPHEAARIMAEVASGLHAAHEQGILHRDVKPANILIDKTGRAILCDFGLALMAGERLTQTGEIMGTPAYMAPEQALGDRELQGPRTDVYGAGAVLYELVTGEKAHKTKGGVAATLASAVRDLPRPPRAINPLVPPELEVVIQRCLEKRPQDRYPTAGALAAELFAIAREESSGARRELAGRRRRTARLAVEVVTLVTLGLVLTVQVATREPRPLPPGGSDPTAVAALAAREVVAVERDARVAWESGTPSARIARLLSGRALIADQLSSASSSFGGPAPSIDALARSRVLLARASLRPAPRRLAMIDRAGHVDGVPERVFIARTLHDAGYDPQSVTQVLVLLGEARDTTNFEDLLAELVHAASWHDRARLVLKARSRSTPATLPAETLALLESDEAALHNALSRAPADAELRADEEATHEARRSLGKHTSTAETPREATSVDRGELRASLNEAYVSLCRDTFGIDPESDARNRGAALSAFEAIARALSSPQANDTIAKKARVGEAVVAARNGDLVLARSKLGEVRSTFGMVDLDGSTTLGETEVALASGEPPSLDVENVRRDGASDQVDLLFRITGARVHAARALSLKGTDPGRARAELATARKLLASARNLPVKLVAEQDTPVALEKLERQLVASFEK